MQVYKSKSMCTGCGACANICPKQCVILQPDEKGFIYPQVDENLCIDCKACKKVCHTYITEKKDFNEQLFGFINPDEHVLKCSSSGGFFYCIASKIIQQKGYVCGVVFDENFYTHHEVTNELDIIKAMCGSKYVQSDTMSVYSDIKKLLNDGNIVLFTGTPCQVIGLKTFLKKEYNNLYTIDFICSSIPSPLIFRKYISEIEEKYGKVKKISFRDKRNGWHDYGISVRCENGEIYDKNKENLYMKGFIGGIYSRESCSHCPAKERIGYLSDLTIGDMWGVQEIMPNVECSMGVSAVIVHTEKGYELVEKEQLIPCDIEMLKIKNPKYHNSYIPYHDLEAFWKILNNKGLKEAFDYVYNPSILKKIKMKFGNKK